MNSVQYCVRPTTASIWSWIGNTQLLLAMKAVFKIEALSHMSSVLKGSQILAFLLKGWFKFKASIQELYRNDYKTHIELVHELHGTCFQCNVNN